MITKMAILALKMETAEGVLNTPLAADCIIVEDLDVSTSFGADEPDYYTGSLSKSEDIPGSESMTITGKVHMKGSGSTGITTYTEPDWINIPKCCGNNVTQATGVTIRGELDIRPHPNPNATGTSASGIVNINGKRYMGAGFRGDLSFEHEVSRAVKASFTLQGALYSIGDAAILVPSGLDTTKAPVWHNASTAFSYDTYEALVSKLTVSMNNDVQPCLTPNSTYGILSYGIVDRDSRGEIDAKEVTSGTYNFSGKARGGTSGVLTYGISKGGVTGTYVDFYAGAAQLPDYNKGERNGWLIAVTPVKYCRVSGDDEYYFRLH